jgi:small subunit ribosomal protein S21
MLIVKVKKGEKIESALKRLKRKFRDTGVMKQLRENKEFTKPSIKRRKEIKKAQYIQKLRDQEENS